MIPAKPSEILAIFDLDGTLVKRQSQILLLRALHRDGHLKQRDIAGILCWFAGYRLGLLHDPKAVMHKAIALLTGWEVEKFDHYLMDFIDRDLIPNLNQDCVDRLLNHREAGHRLVLASNAIEPIARSFGKRAGFEHIIATKLETENGKYTGRFRGEPIMGDKKIALVREYAAESGLSLARAIAYGDHISDGPLLEAVKTPVAVSPDRKLRIKARQRGWTVIEAD